MLLPCCTFVPPSLPVSILWSMYRIEQLLYLPISFASPLVLDLLHNVCRRVTPLTSFSLVFHISVKVDPSCSKSTDLTKSSSFCNHSSNLHAYLCFVSSSLIIQPLISMAISTHPRSAEWYRGLNLWIVGGNYIVIARSCIVDETLLECASSLLGECWDLNLAVCGEPSLA